MSELDNKVNIDKSGNNYLEIVQKQNKATLERMKELADMIVDLSECVTLLENRMNNIESYFEEIYT